MELQRNDFGLKEVQIIAIHIILNLQVVLVGPWFAQFLGLQLQLLLLPLRLAVQQFDYFAFALTLLKKLLKMPCIALVL